MDAAPLPAEPASAPAPAALPRAALYAIAAPLGGHGLGRTSAEAALGLSRARILGGLVAFAVTEPELRARPARTLRFHPARIFGNGGETGEMARKKSAIQTRAANWLRCGKFDFFHGWSGEARLPMIEARRRGLPCILDIPTWHRDKGRLKPYITRTDREKSTATRRGEITRQQILTEYALADLILVPSQASAATFLKADIPPERLFLLGRGVDPARFRPATPPERFRFVFVGSLCRRKGVDLLLAAWKKLALRDAELVLVGNPASDIRDALRECGDLPGLRITGFHPNPQDLLASASAFVFPSLLEGAAKAVYEAAACALPLIATRESGDLIEPGKNGILIPAGDGDALADAMHTLSANPDQARAMGTASRALVESQHTWDHYRARLLRAYARAMG